MADARFAKARQYIENKLGKKQFPDRAELDNSTKLKFYGLFRVASDGANTTSKPGIFDPVGRAKWQAWFAIFLYFSQCRTDVSDRSQEQAKVDYCALLDSTAQGWEQFLAQQP